MTGKKGMTLSERGTEAALRLSLETGVRVTYHPKDREYQVEGYPVFSLGEARRRAKRLQRERAS